jgi:hypothetical protein
LYWQRASATFWPFCKIDVQSTDNEQLESAESGAAFGNACDVFVSTQFLIVIIYQKIKEKNYFP